MTCEQPLKPGKTQPWGLALIIFSTKSTLTLGLSLLGEPLPRGINDHSLNQDNQHLNSQLPAGRRVKAVLWDVPYCVAFPWSPDLSPTPQTQMWAGQTEADVTWDQGRVQQSWGRAVCRDMSLRWGKKLCFLWSYTNQNTLFSPKQLFFKSKSLPFSSKYMGYFKKWNPPQSLRL